MFKFYWTKLSCYEIKTYLPNIFNFIFFSELHNVFQILNYLTIERKKHCKANNKSLNLTKPIKALA